MSRLAEIDGDFAHGLNRVGVKEDSPFMGDAGQFLHGKDDAGFIVGPHDADNGRVVGQVFEQVVDVEAPLAVDGDKGHPVPLFGEVLAQIDHGRVLDPGGDDVPLVRVGLNRRANGRAVAFGAAAGKNDFTGVGAQQIGNPLPGLLDLAAHLAAKGVHAGGVAVIVAEIGKHLFEHFGGHPGGGVVVDIDHAHDYTSSTISSSETSSRSFDST